MRKLLTIPACLSVLFSFGQNAPGVLTVEKIMQDPHWMGVSPENISWSADSKYIYFNWNLQNEAIAPWYKISPNQYKPVKISSSEKNNEMMYGSLIYNQKRNEVLWLKQGDIFYKNTSGKVLRITETADMESNPSFGFNDTKIIYTRNQNLYAWDIRTGSTLQVTNFTNTPETSFNRSEAKLPTQEEWLKKDQLSNMLVLQERKKKRDIMRSSFMSNSATKTPSIYTEGKSPSNINLSNDGRFITYNLYTPGSGKNTIVPDYVTETGFTTDIPGRTKVGTPQGSSTTFLYDRKLDTLYRIKTDEIPGIKDIPSYVKDYPSTYEKMKKEGASRNVSIMGMIWSPTGKYAITEVRAADNKDRWLMLLDTATHSLKLIDRQHDDAWIGGPGMFRSLGWINDETVWFQSEETGYSHLYTFHIPSQSKKALTKGKFEVQQAVLSNDKKSFYITTNEVHPGEKQFYKLNISNASLQRITSLQGANEVSISPDEKYIAFRNSYIDQPWEMYVQENKAGAKPIQITHNARSEAYNQYKWRTPEVISFTARDGAEVYARVYKPQNPDPSKPAVLFVHGAGYLQNAHKWWSSYFREYMFNNLLADNGYYVMDIDYRGSAGYGRDWRTGIYRHMGGKDLTDHVDAVQYMVKNYGINPTNLGIYGGSYGGFITLMGLFTTPDIFKSGAALRPVTDWANYNHGYTANILNEPFNDSIAYKRSSPFYFAKGLKGNLLMCHGMVDVNVHYQDVVKLSQRLIELGKDNWELASYPMEDHGFVEPSSWTDEYKRIFKLFETTLKHKK
ncbi:MAG: S9 family peptidase [Chitinophagaceae bacterium]|nr:MAG: S9 family peptidase [Chitinophagaceae bacterium]